MAEQFTGTATYESPKDKADAKEYADMRKAKPAYFEERAKRLKYHPHVHIHSRPQGRLFL